jgi:hypothetical protein
MGIPVDRVGSFFTKHLHLPTRWSRSLVRRLAYLVTGDQSRFGVPRPAHPIWKEHTTLSQELLPYCGHGWIKIKPNIKMLHDTEVTFEDGSSEKIDAIIYATGYKPTFPFLKPELFKLDDGHASLYRRMLPLKSPGLYMLGLIQPTGPTIPLVEVQAKWIAGILCGSIKLPSENEMHSECVEHQRHLAKSFVGSARYTLEVDGSAYRKKLFADIRRGKAGS